MWNRDYEAEKARYVDSMIFRIMELETENELLKERLNSSGQVLKGNNMQYMSEDLLTKLNEANLKYRAVTQKYAELKTAYDASNPEVSGLRKIAKLYANYGIRGIFKKIWKKLRKS